MVFIRIASVNDLKPGEKLGIIIEDKPVLLVNLENVNYAIARATGALIKGPTSKPEPSYRVRVEGDQIQVEI
jgi:nitrite reductase/ring-hydroxylating ferredoxin subunit